MLLGHSLIIIKWTWGFFPKDLQFDPLPPIPTDNYAQQKSSLKDEAIQWKELNGLHKYMKKVRGSQSSMSINSGTEFSKTEFFAVTIIKYISILSEFWRLLKILKVH